MTLYAWQSHPLHQAINTLQSDFQFQKKLLCKIVNLPRRSPRERLLCFPFSNCPVSLDRKSLREEPLAKMTGRDSAAGTSQVCSRTYARTHREDVQIQPAESMCKQMTECLVVCSLCFSCRPPAGRYLAFLWFEWFPFKLSEELNFRIMGRAKRHWDLFCLFFFFSALLLFTAALWPFADGLQ